MARQGISYEQVSATAQRILAEKRQPTIRAVREYLQTGSASTIQRHLQRWREEFQPLQPVSFEIPTSLTRELQKELARVASVAREDIELRLTQAKEECEILATENETIRAKGGQLEEALEVLRSERDNLAGKAEEQAKHMAELENALGCTRNALTTAQVGATHAENEVREHNQRLDALRAELDGVRKELAEERKARNDAERRLEGLDATHRAATERLAEAQFQAQQAARERDEVRQLLEQQRIAAVKKLGRLKRLGAFKNRRAPIGLQGSRSQES